MRKLSSVSVKLLALGGVVAVFAVPAAAWAGQCNSFGGCNQGNVAASIVSLIGATLFTGLVGVGTLDGGFTGNGDSVDFTAGGPSEASGGDVTGTAGGEA